MGRAGRSGGGGGRSGGFGGSRRSGGFSGGGRSGRTSFGSGSRGGHFFGPSHSRRTVIVTPGGYRRRPVGYGGGGCLGPGAATAVILVVIMIALVMAFSFFVQQSGGGSSSIGASTVAREPLPAGAVDETDYYTDELGWIADAGELTDGLRDFYRETGIQPYLYLTDGVDGSHGATVQELADHSERLYSELFTDEAHFLVVFCEYDGVYNVGYTIGSQAKSVLDDEAIGIFSDYLDRYYYSDLSEEAFFARTFADTAERIMQVTRSPWPVVLIVFGVVVLVVLLFFWWKKHKEQQAREREQAEEMLKTPLETFGDNEAEDLAKKYQQQEADTPVQQAQPPAPGTEEQR